MKSEMPEPQSVATLLADLAAVGIVLRVDGDALRYTAPSGALTDALRARLQAAKPQVMDALRASHSNLVPASLTQSRFWKLQSLDPEWSFYNEGFLFRLTGPLDAGRLRRAADAVVARHESLRTTLRMVDGRLMQHIAPDGAVDWLEQDLRGVDDTAIRAALLTETQRQFDLAADPILRLMLVRTADDGWLLQLCTHNVVFDLNSLMVILDEISRHYAGDTAGLPQPAQYANFAAWQNARAATGMARRRDYWQAWLARGEPPRWSWPACEPRRKGGFGSIITWARLTPERTARLKALSRTHGVTPYIVVLTAYFLAVRSFTGCDDLTIGTTYSDRADYGLSTMIGASIGVPAIRVDMSYDPPIAALLRRVRDSVAAAVVHQDLSVEQVLPRDASGPLFRIVLTNFPDTPHGKLRLPQIRVVWEEEWLNPITRPDLYMMMWETPTPNGMGLTFNLMHRENVWDQDLAERMMTRFESCIAEMMA